jgi:hypothetical protein
MTTHSVNIFARGGKTLVKIAWITFMKNGDISFGLSDKSQNACREHVTAHPDYKVHIKNAEGVVVADALTDFHNPNRIDEWKWCEAVSNPLREIESGSHRAHRTKDQSVVLDVPDLYGSIWIALFKLPQRPRDGCEEKGAGHLNKHISWDKTHLRLEVMDILPTKARIRAIVMN